MPKTIDNVPTGVHPLTKYPWAQWFADAPLEFTAAEFAKFGITVVSFRAQACTYASAHGFRASLTQDARTGSVYLRRRDKNPKNAVKRPRKVAPLPRKKPAGHKKGTKTPAKGPPAQK